MDISPSGLYLQYREVFDGHVEGEMKRVELFPEVSALQTRKSLTLKKINNVLVDLFYSRNDQKIGSISVSGFNEAVDKVAASGKHVLNSKMRIPVLLSSSGHVIFETPVAAIDYEETISRKFTRLIPRPPLLLQLQWLILRKPMEVLQGPLHPHLLQLKMRQSLKSVLRPKLSKSKLKK